MVKSFQCPNPTLKWQPRERDSELLLKPDGEPKAGQARTGAGSRKVTAAAPQLLRPGALQGHSLGRNKPTKVCAAQVETDTDRKSKGLASA